MVHNIYFCLDYILAQCYFKFKGDILNTEIKICILKTSLWYNVWDNINIMEGLLKIWRYYVLSSAFWWQGKIFSLTLPIQMRSKGRGFGLVHNKLSRCTSLLPFIRPNCAPNAKQWLTRTAMFGSLKTLCNTSIIMHIPLAQDFDYKLIKGK